MTSFLRVERQSPCFRMLNEGRPWKLGETPGINETDARAGTAELGNIRLWCDGVFNKQLQPNPLQP